MLDRNSTASASVAQPAAVDATLTELYDRWRETLSELMEMKWCGMSESMIAIQRDIAARAQARWEAAVSGKLTPEWRAACIEQRAGNPGTEGPSGY